MVVSISSSRPMTGSSFSSLAIRVRSRLNSSTVGVELAASRASPSLLTPRTTAPRSLVCETPEAREQPPRLGLFVPGRREQDVLGADVRGT